MEGLKGTEITPAFVEDFYNSAIEGWFDGPIDWEVALDRYERLTGVDFGSNVFSPAITKLTEARRGTTCSGTKKLDAAMRNRARGRGNLTRQRARRNR